MTVQKSAQSGGTQPEHGATCPAPRVKLPNWDCPVRYLGFTAPGNPYRYRRAKTSFLYVMRSGEFLKIGITEDVTERLHALRAGNPHGITLVSQRKVPHALARQIEQRVHAAFAEHCVGREWFRLADHALVTVAATPVIAAAKTAMRRWIEDGFFDRNDP